MPRGEGDCVPIRRLQQIRDACLTITSFWSPTHARVTTIGWKKKHNTSRRHSALRYGSPAQSAEIYAHLRTRDFHDAWAHSRDHHTPVAHAATARSDAIGDRSGSSRSSSLPSWEEPVLVISIATCLYMRTSRTCRQGPLRDASLWGPMRPGSLRVPAAPLRALLILISHIEGRPLPYLSGRTTCSIDASAVMRMATAPDRRGLIVRWWS
ncbi:integrase core domain-containing protein [Nesterenkonia haasae]|uniref:integrase core domain-containing protein n=1 Tax=Nesterenkonia haasae TaxID=2587813 RepID=UPI0038B29493